MWLKLLNKEAVNLILKQNLWNFTSLQTEPDQIPQT